MFEIKETVHVPIYNEISKKCKDADDAITIVEYGFSCFKEMNINISCWHFPLQFIDYLSKQTSMLLMIECTCVNYKPSKYPFPLLWEPNLPGFDCPHDKHL